MSRDEAGCEEHRLRHLDTDAVFTDVFGPSRDANVAAGQLARQTAWKPETVSPLRQFIGGKHRERQQKEIDAGPEKADFQTRGRTVIEPESYPCCHPGNEQSKQCEMRNDRQRVLYTALFTFLTLWSDDEGTALIR